MTDLTATSQQLAQLAERLRASIARFSVLRREQVTAEHRVAPTDVATSPAPIQVVEV
jgi:broad specificity phosphatase PhoE